MQNIFFTDPLPYGVIGFVIIPPLPRKDIVKYPVEKWVITMDNMSKKTADNDSRAIYTPPRVMRIRDLRQGEGMPPPSCSTGSGADGPCDSGNTAQFYCYNGDAPVGYCANGPGGDSPPGPPCISGSMFI